MFSEDYIIKTIIVIWDIDWSLIDSLIVHKVYIVSVSQVIQLFIIEFFEVSYCIGFHYLFNYLVVFFYHSSLFIVVGIIYFFEVLYKLFSFLFLRSFVSLRDYIFYKHNYILSVKSCFLKSSVILKSSFVKSGIIKNFLSFCQNLFLIKCQYIEFQSL